MRKAQETTTQAPKVFDEIQKAGAMFLITDLNLALTFARIAGDAAENSATWFVAPLFGICNQHSLQAV
jgi:hypothetical protein